MDTQNKTDQVPAPRLPLQMQVTYRKNYARQVGSGTLKNISLTGAFLAAESADLAPNDKLILELTVGGRRRKMTASVIWKNTLGCGIQFKPFNNRDVQIVDDLMYFVESRRETRRNVLDDIFKRVA